MTMVASFFSKDYALMVGDLRRTNMNNPSEYFDDCSKIQKVNNNLLIGFSGNSDLAKNILNTLTEQFPPDIKIESVAAILKQQIDILKCFDYMKSELDLTFHLVGLNKANEIVQTSLSQFNDFKYEFIKAVCADKPAWFYSYAEYDPGEWLKKQFNNQSKITLSMLRYIAKDMVKFISQRDKFVSPEGEILTIKRCR